MPAAPPPSPWSLLASGWEELFPLRQPRLDLALGFAGEGARCLDAGCATGSLDRRRTMVSPTLACFETVFHPIGGAPVASRIMHLRMPPERAAALLREAGLRPAPPMADEAGKPFQETSPGWVLVAQRD
jgi:hypothetical protein